MIGTQNIQICFVIFHNNLSQKRKEMDDLALIFSYHNNGETSRKQLHEEDQDHEKANSLSCIISFNNNFENSLLIPKGGANNTISFSNINNNNNIGTQFGGNTRRTGEQAHEHLLAERSRRRKIAKLFVSLASLLPGLNKVCTDSINLYSNNVLMTYLILSLWV